MKKVFSALQMKEYENHTINDIGLFGAILMERAGQELLSVLEDSFDLNKVSVLITCGVGNNGADGLVLARLLSEKSVKCHVFINYGHRESDLFLLQKKILENISFDGFVDDVTAGYDIYVDALLGIGLNKNVDEATLDLIEKINSFEGFKLAVDVPTGLNSTTGFPSPKAVKANCTVTFGAYKSGLLLNKAVDYCGKILLKEIGIWDYDIKSDYFLYTKEDAYKNCYKRINSSNKGTYGKVLIVAGSKDIGGCAYLAAKAAFKCGVGMVKVITHISNRDFLLSNLPELMLKTYEESMDLLDNDFWKESIDWCDAICCGPGISCMEEGMIITDKILSVDKDIILDADAINCISQNPKFLSKLLSRREFTDKALVLTPHKKELERLVNAIEKETENRSLDDLLSLGDLILVEKNARSITKGEDCLINSSGNNGMSTAGCGDVLAGIVGALLAVYAKNPNGIRLLDLVATAVYIHGYAADKSVEKTGISGLTANDICDGIGLIMDEFTL